MDKENIYLDYAANTPVNPEVLKIFNETTLKYFANPNSTHKLGLEVNEKIDALKAKYKDATHYCYSYIIDNIKRFNDDKEPSHTAGMPILNVLESKNLNYVLAVVIRYFGGIKLGAGGLVRAYTNAVSNTISNEFIIPIKKMLKKRITFDYSYINKVNYILKENKITYKEFDKDVIYDFTYEEGNYPKELDNYIK